MALPDLTPPAPRAQIAPAALPAPFTVAPTPAPTSSGVTTTVVQSQNRTTSAVAASAAGSIAALTNASTQNSTTVQAEISDELQRWATAWVDKDLSTYYGHYVPEFKGVNGSNSAWRAARAQVIASRKAIQLELKDIKFTNVSQDRVRVDMIQNYQSDGLKDSIQKSMTFIKQSGRWLIQSESNR
jgi:hypothetical protein